MSLIGERLREARERKNLKQTQVKSRTGINNKTLSGYENGVSEPDLETLKILADLYEVSVDWLAGRTDNMSEKVRESTEGISEWRKKAIEEIYRMPEDEFNYFYELMKRLTKKQ
jgi:transcriptional regulator with XRE-family HTH domain